ncbi:MAG: hypothetical protein C5B45_03405 [Chlamydiae bacterium]|nr:MAG: hypothetical protein C5B45_03405 [Chlamydiota bacterium]
MIYLLSSEMIAFFYSSLKELRNYTSEFELIDRAIEQIPENGTLRLHVIESLQNFNHRIADYCVKEVEELEQQLNKCDQFLGILWAALPIDNKPSLKTITQIREWFEDEKNQSLLDTVTVLNLEDCEISQISKEFFQLRNLEPLNISANNLISLPSSIGQFKELQELKAEVNYLLELPKEIGQCSSLRIIKVSENQIAKLPEELKYLTLLQQFCIADNELTLSSEDLERLELYNWRQLQEVDLSENALENVTTEFVKRLWPSVTTIDL